MYDHFITLHVSIRILCGKSSDEELLYSEKILIHFVNQFITLYGVELVSHNIHGLIHLTDDVRRLGPLDSFSAFPFENFMRVLKGFLRKHDKPLHQLHRRYVLKYKK
ncbi:hypothetical protein PPYR_15647, partial [Photinus pyralis]